MVKTSCKMLQISDVHLFADRKKKLLGVPTRDSFHSVVEYIQQNEAEPDFILLSGDLSQDGSPESYHAIADEVTPLKVPIYFLPGNHDNPEVMYNIYPKNKILADKKIMLNNWDFLLLNTHKSLSVAGHLSDAELDFLEIELRENQSDHIAICLHHHPFSVGVKWLDPIGLRNADAFWKILNSYQHKVRVIIFGHVHQVHESKHNEIPCYSAPSTCIQFKPNQVEFALDEANPGYRFWQFYEDGSFDTLVKRLPHYVGEFARDSKGY